MALNARVCARERRGGGGKNVLKYKADVRAAYLFGGCGAQLIDPPFFRHKNRSEPIRDLSQTFDALRASKSRKFPELTDASRVIWEIAYGPVRRFIVSPEKTRVGELKLSIELSGEFREAARNSVPVCVIRPHILPVCRSVKMPVPPFRCPVLTIRRGKIRVSADVFTPPTGEVGSIKKRLGIPAFLPVVKYNT